MNQIVPPSSNSAPASSRDRDEIDLVDLLRFLWADRAVIALITAVCVVGAAVYAFTTTPLYESEGVYTPPPQQQLLQIMPQSVKDFEFDKEIAFGEFKAQVQSNRVKNSFFKTNVWTQEEQAEGPGTDYYNSYRKFDESLKISVPGPQETDKYVRVNYQSDDPVKAAQLISQYAAYANESALRQLKEDFVAFKAGAVDTIVREVESLKFISDHKKVQRIEKLTSALSVAKALGIRENRVGQAVSGGVFGTEDNRAGINLVEPPLYMYGVDELVAQIDALEKSKGSYFDVDKLPELESQLAQLREVTFRADRGVVYTEQGVPLPDFAPVKPRKALILALAGVAGLMVGVFISLLRSAFRRDKAVAT